MASPAVAEAFPPPAGFLNPEVARAAGLKSGQSRRAIAERIAAIDRITDKLIPSVELLVTQPLKPVNREHVQAMELLESHLAQLDQQLAKAEKAADWRDYATARAKLFEQWAHLAGIPKPIDHHRPQGRSRVGSKLPAMPAIELAAEVQEAAPTEPSEPAP